MRRFFRTHLTTMLVAALTAAVTAGGPALASAVAQAVNADTVDYKHAVGAGASVDNRAGKLVATNGDGQLPNNIIDKAPDANRLDNLDSSAFLLKGAKAADAEQLDNLDSTQFWTKAETAEFRALQFTDVTSNTWSLSPAGCVSYNGLLVTVEAPGPGIIDLNAVIQLRLDHTLNQTTSVRLQVGTTTSDCDAINVGGSGGTGFIQLPFQLPSGLYFDTLPVNRVLPVSAAGTYTFYVTGTTSGGAETSKFWYGRLNATFYPTG
jgi:hypothetical protein